MSARDVLAMALVRHIEGDSVTRDLITDDEWAGYLSDADYVSGLIAAAGYAVVPVEAPEDATEFLDMWVGDNSDRANESVWNAIQTLRAMIAASQESAR